MHLSPRVRACTNATSRLTAGAIMPLLGTCALAAGLGVGLLYAAAHGGASRSQESPPPPAVVDQPAPTVVQQPAPAAVAAPPLAEQSTAAQSAPQSTAPVGIADAAAPIGAASAVYPPSRPNPLADLPARPLTPTAAASGASFGV